MTIATLASRLILENICATKLEGGLEENGVLCWITPIRR